MKKPPEFGAIAYRKYLKTKKYSEISRMVRIKMVNGRSLGGLYCGRKSFQHPNYAHLDNVR